MSSSRRTFLSQIGAATVAASVINIDAAKARCWFSKASPAFASAFVLFFLLSEVCAVAVDKHRNRSNPKMVSIDEREFAILRSDIAVLLSANGKNANSNPWNKCKLSQFHEQTAPDSNSHQFVVCNRWPW